MRKHPSIIKKLLALFAIPLFGVVAASSASAWGPERTMYTMANPAESATFNSIKDNPTIGDERDFVRVGQINADVTELGNEVEVLPGHQYLVYVYYHNDASSTYNGPEYNNRGVAFKSRMSTTFPTVLKSKESGTVSATITAQNTNPLSVWDEATFVNNTGDKLVLNYVAGSAKIRNDWGTNGTVLSSNLFSEEGTLLGLNALNGIILGCEEYHGVVTYVVEARALSGSVTKTASTDGKTFSSKVTVTPGAEITFKLAIKNTGDIALTNATIKDSLPKDLTLISGTTELWANDSTTKDKLSDDIATKGFNLGRLGLGNTVYITYKAKARDDVDCKGISVTNTATLTYDSEASSGDSKSSTAKVTIKKTECDNEPTPTPTKDPSGSIEKSVSADGSNFTSKVTVTPGAEVTFKLAIKNTSEVALTNIIVKDALPDGLALISGSAESWLGNSTTKDKVPDSIVSSGIKINNLGAGNTFYITYKVKTREDVDCPGVDLTNVATLSYDSKKASDDGSDRASAEVVVEKTGCNEEPTPTPIPDPEPEIPEEIVKTGPLEITMAIVVTLAIVGAGFYLWHSKHTLKSVEDKISGKNK